MACGDGLCADLGEDATCSDLTAGASERQRKGAWMDRLRVSLIEELIPTEGNPTRAINALPRTVRSKRTLWRAWSRATPRDREG